MNYTQLINSQRYQIESYLKANYSLTKIANELGVHKSTISRELKRNGKKRSYNAHYAEYIGRECRKEAYKHSVFDYTMKCYIDDRLINHQLSPEQMEQDESIKKQMVNLLAPFKELVITITSDNGKEFTEHQDIAKKLKADLFFANPYSPWQRGLNEYNNKLIRQYLPKKKDFNLITHQTINMII